MNISFLVDKIQRRINSILFRLLLIGYCFYLVCIQTNAFESWVYAVAIIAYFVIYINLINYDKLRLMWDYVFIGIVLFGKNPNDVVNFSLLLFPIVNSINFSGKKKSMLLYIFTFCAYFGVLCYYSSNVEVGFVCSNLYPIGAFVFLWLINTYTSLRTKVRFFREELSEAVDNYYVKKNEIRRPHKIYEVLKTVIHKNIKRELVDQIICLTIVKRKDGERLAFVNGSIFYWFVKFSSKNVVERLREKGSLQNEKITTERGISNFNMIVYVKVEETEYAFAILTQGRIPFYYVLIGIFRTVDPAFYKIGRILLSERKLLEMRNEEVRKLSERSQYVHRANKTMHFMRNRLGPFSNLLKMLDNFDLVPPDKVASFNKVLMEERDRAKHELTNITQRANDMLEKSSNPFVYQQLQTTSIEKVFTILRRNFNAYFPDEQITVKEPNVVGQYYTAINEEGFEIFLSDWLNNMSKYKRKTAECRFEVEDDKIVIKFVNDHNNGSEDMHAMIADLTSNDRNEIMKRTTHGLPIIKATLEDMNIGFGITNDDERKILTFSITLLIISR
jgi:hypothetical protein